MRNLITIVVVLVVGLVAFNYFQSGEFNLLPSSKSDEEQEVNRLRGEFRRVAQDFRQAGRAAGLSGMDTTAAASAAARSIEGIERDLQKLRRATDEDRVRDEIDSVMAEIAEFKEKVF